VLDLAVGVIIGAAFQSLVTSLTDNIISPILGCLTEVDFNAYVLKIGNLTLKYGAFLTDVINFIIMAFIVFLIVKVMNKILVKKEEEVVEEVEEEVPADIQLLEEIRDLLKEKNKEDKSK
jgi:large conductance mechanosensitive channel